MENKEIIKLIKKLKRRQRKDAVESDLLKGRLFTPEMMANAFDNYLDYLISEIEDLKSKLFHSQQTSGCVHTDTSQKDVLSNEVELEKVKTADTNDKIELPCNCWEGYVCGYCKDRKSKQGLGK